MRHTTRIRRKPGDHIRFQVMPWLKGIFFSSSPIYEGTIVDVVNPPDGDTYYHVNAVIDGKQKDDAMIFEREVVKDDADFVKKRWYGCHCIVCPPPPRKLRKCWVRKRYRTHRRELQAIEKRIKRLRDRS